VSIVSSDIPQKIPLISIPVHVGHSMAKEICRCYSMVKPLVKSIKLILFDRGFFSKELILKLNKAGYPYLIFVPKNKKVKKELEKMALYEKKKIIYELKLNKNKTVIKSETTLAGFRVQDEAHIMSKSVNTNIRFFYFVYEQVLQLLWVVLYKEEVSFKEFLLGLYEFL
jgi:predicted DNA-binding transcriptional regulator